MQIISLQLIIDNSFSFSHNSVAALYISSMLLINTNMPLRSRDAEHVAC